MQIEIKRLHRESGATIVYVTHDQEEALALSDRICLMNHARIEQLGTPHDIYMRPRSAFAADFIGISNILRGTLSRGQDGTRRLVTPCGAFVVPSTGADLTGEAALVVRPEHLLPRGDLPNRLDVPVRDIVYAGSETRIIAMLPDDREIVIRLPAGASVPHRGEMMTVGWMPDSGVLVP
jgi:putative spermidine/putrescine transport system ATP-binding protein